MQKYITVKIFFLLFLLLPQVIFAKTSTTDYLKTAEKELPKACLFHFKMYLNASDTTAFAYASDSEEKVTCRFSSTSKTQKEANEIALASCKKSALEKGIISKCKIYRIDKKYKKNTNIASKKIKPTTKDKNIVPKPCQMFYHLYQEANEHKAFAIAVQSDTKYACRYSAGSQSKKKAEEIALNSCQRVRIERKIKVPCHLLTTKVDKPVKVHTKKVYHHRGRVSAALKDAIISADLKRIKKLIKQGADINTEASDKSRALYVAVAYGDLTFAKALLKKGAYVFIKKRDRNNLLVAAIMSGSNTMLRLMLEQGINPNIRCEDGNTPLHFALMMFDYSMMKTLYKFHARDDIKNRDGKSVKDLAKKFHVNLKRVKR